MTDFEQRAKCTAIGVRLGYELGHLRGGGLEYSSVNPEKVECLGNLVREAVDCGMVPKDVLPSVEQLVKARHEMTEREAYDALYALTDILLHPDLGTPKPCPVPDSGRMNMAELTYRFTESINQ